ncbi:VP2 [Orgyia pseudotsugata cypovirus 5]|uniref:VP2 n=1 Tax=Orgyia pseudotsugata cypovirus TaxID=31592 RepID=W6EW39_CPVOP|nr:VP2 [Orgyia pseudotsugata cypovirus 5]
MSRVRNETIKYVTSLLRTNRTTNIHKEIDNEIREWFESNRSLNEIARKIAWTEKMQETLTNVEQLSFDDYEIRFRNDFRKEEYEGHVDTNEEKIDFEIGDVIIRYQIFELLPDISEQTKGEYVHEYLFQWKTDDNLEITIKILISYTICEIDEDDNRLVKINEVTIVTSENGSTADVSQTIEVMSEAQHIEISIKKIIFNEILTALVGTDEIDGMPIEKVRVLENGHLYVKVDAYIYDDVKQYILEMKEEEIFIVEEDKTHLNKSNDIQLELIEFKRSAVTLRLKLGLTSITSNLPELNNSIQIQLVTKETVTETEIRPQSRNTALDICMISMINEMEKDRDRIRIEDINDYLQSIREMWIQEALERSDELEHYLARMTFSNTARIDDLFATVPRYVEQVLEITSLITGQFYDRPMVSPAEGKISMVSPFRKAGYNEIDRTVNTEGINNPRNYEMDLTYTMTMPTSTGVEGRFEIYSQDNFKILVDGSYEMSSKQNTIDPIERIDWEANSSRSYYNFDLQARKVGLLEGTTHRGQIPIPVNETTYTLRVNRVYILDNRGIDAPLIDEVAGEVTLYAVNMQGNGGTQNRKVALANGDSTIMVVDGIRYSGMVFNINETFQHDLFNDNQEYMYYHYGTQSQWLADRSTRTITSNNEITRTETTATTRLNADWEGRQGLSWRQRSRWITEQYHNLLQTRYVRMQELSATMHLNGRQIGDAIGLYVRQAKFNILQQGLMHNGVRYRWDQFMPTQPAGSVTGVNGFRLLGAFMIALDGVKINYRIPMTPVGVGITKIYDSAVRDMQLTMESMELEIQRINVMLEEIWDRLEYIESLVKSMIGDDDIWSNVIGAVLSIIMDVGLTVALGGLGYAASALVKGGVGAMKVAATTLSKSKKVFDSLKRQITKAGSTPIEAINKHSFAHLSVREAKYNGPSWSRIPSKLDVDEKLRLDDDFRYSMLLPEFSMGTRNTAYTRRRDEVRLLMNVPEDYSGPVSKFGIHYQPLKVGGLSEITQKLFDKINFDKLDAKYMFRANKMKARKPAHAWSSIESFEQSKDGKMIRSLTVFGVGEHGGLNANSMSGKIDGITFRENVSRRDENGRIVSKLLSPNESGYSDNEVREIFEKRFKMPSSALTIDECWALLHKKVSTSVLNSKSAHEFTFASPYMHKVIEDIIKNPPTNQYNLWSRNCQHLVNDINRYIKGYPINDAWGLDMNRRMDSVVFRGMSRTLDLIDSAAKLMRKLEPKSYRIKRKRIMYISSPTRGSVLNG